MERKEVVPIVVAMNVHPKAKKVYGKEGVLGVPLQPYQRRAWLAATPVSNLVMLAGYAWFIKLKRVFVDVI